MTMNHVRVKKWVCYDFYFDQWQARVLHNTPEYVAENPDKFDHYGNADGHGSRCGIYLVSIEDIEE